MRLVRQTKLHFQKGTSDKVYEVDLCEAGDGEFIVNFRYGRRGQRLKEGTKTPIPESRSKAETLFFKLVFEKKAKGYNVTDENMVPTPQPQPELAALKAPENRDDPKVHAVLYRLKKGRVKDKWKIFPARSGGRASGSFPRLFPI